MPFNPAVKTDLGREAFPMLKPITKETAQAAQRKAIESRMLNKEIRESFRRNAVAFQEVLKDIPDFSPLEVMKMCVHLALQDNNYEDAARWAKEIAEYKEPKMARKEAPKEKDTKDLSDEELQKLLVQEGLSSVTLVEESVVEEAVLTPEQERAKRLAELEKKLIEEQKGL